MGKLLWCQRMAGNRRKNVHRIQWQAVLFACLMLLFTGYLVAVQPLQTAEAKRITGTEQLNQVFRKSIKNGKDTITFSSSDSYTTYQIQNALQDAAISQNRMLAGNVRIVRNIDATGVYQYQIELSKDALLKIKVLKSKRAAVKAAADVIKNSKYAKKFYSETSYYDVFLRLLQQHPEYNYDTSVWRNSYGAYGYQRSNTLTQKQQKEKMAAANRAAQLAVQKCITSGMTDKQKAKAIHNYIIKHCQYALTQDSFTAYGALVGKSAVCQGYAAAFNLMAQKCGLQSMAVSGTARGGAHAWSYVKLGSKYRYIDCTWDDTGTVGKGIVHIYFNVTAQEMRKDHFWNENDFPSSDIKYYKYFM